jgi:hypothetical protein
MAALNWDLTFKVIVVILLIVILVLEAISLGYLDNKSSGFNGGDPNNIRQYQLVGDQSQNDRQIDAIARSRSGMTGSRDIPVFFQDYDYDMSLSKTGLSNAREGMVDPSVNKKLNNLGA